MVCRMVEKELPAGLISVFLPRAVESFSDMVDIVGREVIGDTGSLDGASTGEMLQAIGDSLRTRGRRLVIVFEEAEKIYLATLERIRKMLDRVNDDGLLLHLVLSGRPALSESLEQLGIVAFQEVDERNLLLDNLDRETTQAYLDQSLRIATGDKDRVIPADIGAGIYAASLGNFRIINQLAHEYVQSEQQDEPFLVLLDTIHAANARRAGGRERRYRAVPGMPKVDLDFLSLPKIEAKWLWTGGGLAAVLVAVFFLVARSPEDVDPQPDKSDVPIIELRAVEPLADAPAVVPVEPAMDEGEGVPDGAPGVAATAEVDAPHGEDEIPAARQDSPTVPVDEPPDDSPLALAPPPGGDDGEKDVAMAAKPTGRLPDGGNRIVVSGPTTADGQPEVIEQPETTGGRQIEEQVAAETKPPSPEPEPVAETVAERPTLVATNVKKVLAPIQAGAGEEPQQETATAAPADSSRDTMADAEDDDSPVAAVEQVIGRTPAEKKAVVQPPPVTIFDEVKKEATAVATAEPELRLESTAAPVSVPEAEPATNDTVAVVDNESQLPETVTEPADEMPSPGPAATPARDSLYKERLAAGARWLVGGGSGRFTVQLMVLTSEQAEENLQQMLEEKEYRSVADNLFVLRRLGDPPTVMLYFGEYRTFAAAQQARNTLPVFLRKHDPYPIAVNAAVEKTRMLP